MAPKKNNNPDVLLGEANKKVAGVRFILHQNKQEILKKRTMLLIFASPVLDHFTLECSQVSKSISTLLQRMKRQRNFINDLTVSFKSSQHSTSKIKVSIKENCEKYAVYLL